VTGRPEPTEPAELELAPEPAIDLEDQAGLFGAATAGTFDPVPVVTLDGADVAAGVDSEGGVPAGLIVVDGLEFTWGREEVLEQPEAATARLQLFDPSGTWATSSDLRGKLVTLDWTGQVAGEPTPRRRVMFRGRVGHPVKVVRKVVQLPDGNTIQGSLVTMPLVSILLDLANIRPSVAWPEETVEERRARIAAAAASVVSDVVVRDYWKPPKVVAVAAKDQVSLYQHLVDLYDSTGADRMNYQPDSNVVTFLERRDYYSSRGHGQLWWDQSTGARAGQGVYVRATGNSAVYLGLDSAGLEYDPGEGITQPERLTRVELAHPSATTSFSTRVVTRLVTGQNEKQNGVRTVRLESKLTWDNYADTAASDLEDMTQKEAAQWRLEPLVLRTRPLGGFEHHDHAELFLKGSESHELLFLQRSWLPNFGLRPVVGVMGGTVTYRNQGWEVELVPAPITTTLPQHAITFEELDDGSAGYEVQWWDSDHPRGMHESLTFEDLGHVSRGMGAAPSIGPDTGWDTLQ
jgi:hypothetical protein